MIMDTNSQQSDGTETKLYAYQSFSHKAAIFATLLIPFGTVAFFLGICSQGGKYALDSSVKTTVAMRWGLILHGAYFIQLPFGFELLLNLWPFTMFGKMPTRPDNLFWMTTCLAGELFFVTAVAYFLMASQSEVPRWTLLVPIAQCAYNLKNDLLWVGFGTIFSPIKERNKFMLLDWMCIFSFFVIYVHHFFTA